MAETPKNPFENFKVEVDPERIEEAVRTIQEQVRRLVIQGKHTKVRIKYKGKALMPDIPLPVFVATEAVTFWYAGLLRALVVNLGVKTFIEVEVVHDAHQRVAEGVDLFMDGEVDLAEKKYREALEMKPDDTSALYNLGVLLRVTGRRDEALQCFERAAADKDHPDAAKAQEAVEKMQRGVRTL